MNFSPRRRSTAQKSHCVNSIGDPRKKNACRPRAVSNVSSPGTQPKFGRECCVEKKHLTSMAVPQNITISVIAHKVHRKEFNSITGLVNSKKQQARNYYSGYGFYQFQNKRSVPVDDSSEMVPRTGRQNMFLYRPDKVLPKDGMHCRKRMLWELGPLGPATPDGLTMSSAAVQNPHTPAHQPEEMLLFFFFFSKYLSNFQKGREDLHSCRSHSANAVLSFVFLRSFVGCVGIGARSRRLSWYTLNG